MENANKNFYFYFFPLFIATFILFMNILHFSAAVHLQKEVDRW